MEIVFSVESSSDTSNKIRELVAKEEIINQSLSQKKYSDDLQYLYIRVLCLSPKMDDLFPPLPPRHYAKPTNYMHRGERLQKPAGTFEYDLRLNFQQYKEMDDCSKHFANDLLDTINIIKTARQLKSVDVEMVKSDLKGILAAIGWIS